jgi:hypothetical protein
MGRSAAAVEAQAAATSRGAAAQERAAAVVTEATTAEEAALVRLQEAEKLVATRSGEMAAAQEAAAAKTGISNAALKGTTIAAGATAIAVGVIGEKSVKAAGEFEASTTRLITSAGETHRNIDLVRQGMLQMAGDVGYSTAQLSQALYTVESGGQHGADGLKVLRAAAEGAKTENAELHTVADAVTSVLVDYHLKAGDAASVTSKLVAATSAGKTTFEQLSGSLASVLPVASAAHVSLDDVLGDLASMTVHGMSAQQASQNLADTIRHMQNPTAVQAKELAVLGLTTNQLADDLKSKGLSGTLNTISDRVRNLMPPGSDRVIADLGTALGGLSPQVRELGLHLFDGSMSMKEYTKAAQALDPISGKQALSFGTLAGSMHRIGDQQTTGAQIMQTYGAALAKATGDATGLNTMLMISGENSGTTADAIRTVAGAATEAGNHVKGWGDIQGTFNFKLDALKGKLEASKIALGTGLLPAATSLLSTITGILTPLTSWITAHQQLTAQLLLGAGAVGAFIASVLVIAKAVSVISTVANLLRLATIAHAAYNAVVAIGNTTLLTWVRVKAIEAGEWIRSTAATIANTVATGANNAARFVASGALLAWVTEKGVELGAWIASTAATAASTVALGAHAAITGVVRAATIAWTAAQWLLNVALDANPIGIVVLAIAALVAIIVLIATKTTWFQDLWRVAWGWIKQTALDVWNWIKGNWPLLLEILTGPFGIAIGFIINHWTQIKNACISAWNFIKSEVFDRFADVVMNKIPAAFRSGVDAIGRAWQGLQDVAKAPVRFVVNTVLNDGLLAAYNWVAHTFGVKPDNVHVSLPAGFAGGGYTGPGGKYEPAGIVHRDEHVMPSERTRRWLPILESIRLHDQLPMYPGDLSGLGLPGYASGGVVGALEGLGSGLWDLFTDPAKLVRGPVNALIDRIPGGGAFRDVLVGGGHKVLDGLIGWIKGSSGSGLAGKAMAFLKTAVGHGYGLGSAGPDLWDCSGIVSSVYNVLHGGNPYVHTFSTMNEAPFFPLAGIGGLLSAGWTNPGEPGPGGNGIGHTAGVLAGVPFESTGGVGVRMGAGVTPIGSFAHVGHFDQGGPLYPGWNAVYNGTRGMEYVADPRGGGPGGQQVYIDLRESKFMTDRDIDALLDKLDKRLVRTLLPGAGVQVRR